MGSAIWGSFGLNFLIFLSFFTAGKNKAKQNKENDYSKVRNFPEDGILHKGGHCSLVSEHRLWNQIVRGQIRAFPLTGI